MDCLFCKIIAGTIESKIVYEDEHLIVIDDIKPRAPIHKLIIPKKHVATLNDLKEEDECLYGHIIITGSKLAQKLDISNDGYRVVINCNSMGGQDIYHLHVHLLGGRQMHWPPG